MARIRKDGTILLNALQFATFEELKVRALGDIILRNDISLYKANVIRGIAKHGAIKRFGRAKFDGSTDYRLVRDAVVILQPAPTPRTMVADEIALAA